MEPATPHQLSKREKKAQNYLHDFRQSSVEGFKENRNVWSKNFGDSLMGSFLDGSVFQTFFLSQSQDQMRRCGPPRKCTPDLLFCDYGLGPLEAAWVSLK